ncbi:MAG: hypothetical protein ACUVUC_07655 [Thermoguttaceae bacterium]
MGKWSGLAWAAVLWFWGDCAAGADPPHPVMTWVKRHPRPEAEKPSPRMGYETTYGYDPAQKLLIRYGGHNQGGGGEQNSEVWTYDLARDVWTLKEPNDAPPGVCCGQQNVFDESLGKFIRFPSFSGSHGWQSRREIDLKDSSVWTYDLPTNTWRAMRPCPEVWPSPLRGAAYDPHHQLTVVHGGEGARHGTAVYDLYANAWHELKPPGGPASNISQPGFAYDAVHRVFVLFGSQFQEDERTWVYDLRQNTWRVLDVKEHPPAKKSCPVLAADTRNGIVLCNVQRDSGLQTWALDVSVPRWTRLNVGREPDPSGARNRVLLYLADQNLFVLENRTSQEQQIWTFRYAEAPGMLPGPRGLRVATEAESATLSWQAPPGADQGPYSVYRGEGQRPWEVRLRPIAHSVQQTSFKDRGLQRGTIYFYQVRLAGPEQDKAAPSLLVRTQPPVVTQLTVSVLDRHRAELVWANSPAQDVIGYHVERADVSVYSTDQVVPIKERYRVGSDLAAGRIKTIGTFRRLTAEPLAACRYLDGTVDLAAGQREPAEPLQQRPLYPQQFDPKGRPYRYAVYAYRVIAVNRLGVESGPSPLAFTYPSAVQFVFAKEEGKDQTRLKWQPNPEQAIAGYLVYRQDGRWNKDAISRLTREPIQDTEFLDQQAGPGTRRYEIVAVDRLGQEGEPSQPVWSRREWFRYYIPYIGPWHQ